LRAGQNELGRFLTSNSRILVLAPYYRDFVKGIIDAIAEKVESVTVLVHHNRLSEVTAFLPNRGYLSHVRNFGLKRLIDTGLKPTNVTISHLDMTYLVPDGKSRSLGDLVYSRANRFVTTNATRFDLIQGHFTWPCGYAAVRLAHRYAKPSVLVVHENREWLLQLARPKGSSSQWVWRNADGLFRVNKIDVPMLKKYNNNVTSIAGGFDPKAFFPLPKAEARATLGLPLAVPLIFSLGVLVERKGFHILISAMSELVLSYPNLTLVIGGDGPLRNALRKKIVSLGLENNVKMVGHIPSSLLNYYYNSADIFVLSSLSEGNPTVIFEALASGLPIVCTGVGGAPEIISSDAYGILVTPGSVENLSIGIREGLAMKWNRERILAYSQQFSWRACIQPLIAQYDSLGLTSKLSEGKPPSTAR
jgi:teichuronic acid biosynthesis glycosyltransferase TuaC